MGEPRTSVVAYVYNGARWVREMVDSVLGQTCRDFEFFFLDDGSTDGTGDIVHSFDDTRIRYEYQERRGRERLHETFNRCIEAAPGEYIAIANADDVLEPTKLERQIALLDARPEIDVSFHDALFIDGNGRPLPGTFAPSLARELFEWGRLGPHMFQRNWIPNPTVVFRKSLVERIGLQEYGWPHDYQFWLKAAMAGTRFHFLPERLLRYRVHEASHSTSSARLGRLTSEVHRMLTEMYARYTIEDFYPEIAACSDPVRARGVAHLDLAVKLATRPDPLAEIAEDELRAAGAAVPELIETSVGRDPVRLDDEELFLRRREAPAARAVSAPARSVQARPMRVLLVAHNYPFHWAGGTELYTQGFARALAETGSEVAVLYPYIDTNTGGISISEKDDGGIRVVRLTLPEEPGYRAQARHAEVEHALAEFLAGESFDVVHFQHTWKNLPFSAIRVARESGARICLTLHDFWFACHETHLIPSYSSELCSGPEGTAKCLRCVLAGLQNPENTHTRLLEGVLAERMGAARDALAACDVISAPSSYLREKMLGYGLTSKPIEHRPLGLAPIPKVVDSPGEEIRFAFIGSFAPLKNPAGLAEAFREVRGPARLSFYGSGDEPSEARLRALALLDPRIVIVGRFEAESLGRVLGEIDVLVLASKIENYPLSLREALAARRPVIASRVGGVPEIVTDGENGLLVEPGDHGGLRDAMQRMVDDPALIGRLRAGISPVKTMAEDATEWLATYQSLCKEEAVADTGVDDRAVAALLGSI